VRTNSSAQEFLKEAEFYSLSPQNVSIVVEPKVNKCKDFSKNVRQLPLRYGQPYIDR